MNGVMKVPMATSSTPVSSTRPVPTLSAIAPAKGCVSPHHSWPKAKARLICPRPRPVAVFSEPRNRPIVWRVPMVSANTPAAASSTSPSGQRCGSADEGLFIVAPRSPVPVARAPGPNIGA